MYRINKVCIDLLLLLILFAGSISAQVVTTPSGYPVIDLSTLSPLGVVLSSAEAASRRTTMNQQTPSTTSYLVGSSVSGHNGSWNAKMSIKYQVMRANLRVGVNWVSAWNACKSYNGEGGGAGTWRLPTQREYQMIWILHPQLIGKGGFTSFSANFYWSATERTATIAWYMGFHNGDMSFIDKTGTHSVRCVRDL